MVTRRTPAALAKAPDSTRDAAREQRGIQSVEVGGQLLLALAHQGRSLPLKDLARNAGMSPAKAHPYLVSFGKIGLIARDDATGHYGLGPLALQLGLISLQQFDPVRLATPMLEDLAKALGHTVAIAVWGTRGATVVRIEEAPSAVHVNMRHGTVLRLRGTASGLLFAAYLPRETVLDALADELALELRQQGKPVPARLRASIDAGFEAELAEVRRHRLSRVSGAVVAGVSAMAAPVFNETGRIVMCFIAIGPTSIFDEHIDGVVARGLRSSADDLSRQLGAGAASSDGKG